MIPAGLDIVLDRGGRVFPLGRGAKEPAISKVEGGRGCHDATNDRVQIADWAVRFPSANWAMATGHGQVALDVDNKKGHDGDGTLTDLLTKYGDLPATLTNLTPGRGRHYLFLTDAPVRNSASRLGDGLDVRGTGGYIVIPPSHLTHGAYAWRDAAQPIASLPGWLAELLTKRPDVADPLALKAQIEEGSRHEQLVAYLGTLKNRGMSDEQIAREALHFNQHRCSPPLPTAEFQRTVRDAMGWKREFGLHDTGNAQRIVTYHGTDFRFVHEFEEFIVWRDERWQRDPCGLWVMRMAKDSALRGLAEVPDKEGKSAQSAHKTHITKSQNTGKLEAALKNARSEPGVDVPLAALDADQLLIGARNGVIDLRTGEFRRAVREDFITLSLGCDYVPSATAPLWQSVLQRATGNDPQFAAYLQELFGVSLIGNLFRLVIFIYGPTGAAKSVVLEVLKSMFGQYGRAASVDLFMSGAMRSKNGPTEGLARLAGARIVTVSETNQNDSFDEGFVKDVTGGDTVVARNPYERSFEFKPRFMIWIRGNHKPRFAGDDAAMLERLRLVPFTQQVPEAERDPMLHSKICEAELPGILNWALEGALRVQKNRRVVTPDQVRAATAAYAAEMDTLGMFLDERCVLRGDARTQADDLHKAFVEWFPGPKHMAWSRQRFGRQLGERFESKKLGNHKFYFGVELAQL
jgi:P4 family phage/plasmid primase-like protien